MKKCQLRLCLTLGIFLVLFTLCESTGRVDDHRENEPCDSSNCRLPLCKCSDIRGPEEKIDLRDTPMMVALSFNGIITTEHSKFIKKILNPIFKNPNGCGIQATFFLSESGNGTTDYCLAQTLFNNNNEIGIGAPKYSCPYTDCESFGSQFVKWNNEKAEKQIFQQKRNIAIKAKINQSFLRGFRSPLVDQGGNAHFRALKKFGFNYDSSAIVKSADIKRTNYTRQWPHTLDFPPSYQCPTCPDKESLNCKENSNNCSMNGIWVVPMHTLNIKEENSNNRKEINRTCSSLINNYIAEDRMQNKNCYQSSEITQKVIEDQLIENFQSHYKPNKAPFVINIETAWFEKYGNILTDALVQFIDELTKPDPNNKNDIYFVSIAKIIEWLEYPAPLDVIANKWLWDCDGINYDYDEECESIKKLTESSQELEEIKKKNKTKELELKAEDLFRNGVLTSVIIIFILSLLFTVIYDKYNM